MLVLRGAPALSDFRIQKLTKQLASLGINVASIYAEFVHLVDVSNELDQQELTTLGKLLTYGPKSTQGNTQGRLVFTTPRLGTISPWASKATDIAHNCGLSKIRRIERGCAYYIKTIS